MKINIYRNKIRRFNTIRFEIKRRIILFLLRSQHLKNSEKIYLLKKFSKILKKGTGVNIIKCCSITGRSRGSISLYNLSRIIFKELCSNGKITGISRYNY
uniref:Ribosomal protein S14 n=1 Tax=Cyanophora paradoxa TaxID=2762 RepID=A0A097PBQ6_CYAPA|nr:ribosomal protein S14 [Cyanophora paradoxa]